MRWILQTNVYSEEGWESIHDAITRRGLPLTLVKVIPFGGGMHLESGELPKVDEKSIVMGTYTLTNYAKHMGWKPGAFLDNLDFETQRSKWGSLMLNGDSRVFPFSSIPEDLFELPMFVRPVHDTKAFTGRVIDVSEYREWRDRVCEMWERQELHHSDPLIPDTPVQVGAKKEIWSETRTWVIPGTMRYGTSLTPVVTSSQYKVGTIKRYQEPNYTDLRILEFVDHVTSIWRPNDAFVMDVADTPEGLRVVEVNNLNSAGFYKADMGRLVEALEERFG